MNITNEKNGKVVSARVFNLINKLLRLDKGTRDADTGAVFFNSFYDEWVVHFSKGFVIPKDELINSEEPEEYVIELLEKNKQEFCAAIERQKEEVRSLKTFPHPSV